MGVHYDIIIIITIRGSWVTLICSVETVATSGSPFKIQFV
jgi:hypothetical protein